MLSFTEVDGCMKHGWRSWWTATAIRTALSLTEYGLLIPAEYGSEPIR